VRKSTISRYESGTIPGDENLRKIAELGNVTVEWLLRGDQPSAPQFSEPSPSPSPPLDVALIAEILTEIKKVMGEKNEKLSPPREARLVALIYSHCQEGKKKPDCDLVDRCLWITRVD
jgi:hypothetical protein